MSDALESGGQIQVEGMKLPPKKPRLDRKTLLTVALVSVLIISSLGVWYIFVRPWSISEVASKIIDSENAPGFEPSLAGRTVMVAGRVTEVNVNYTSLGPLTLTELDDFNEIHLVDWKEPTHEVGDIISRRVHFEWSRFNDDIRVFSPQLDSPGFRVAVGVPVVVAAVSCIMGICPHVRNDLSSNDTIVEITLPEHEGFPLGLFHATLRKGVTSGYAEYLDISDGYRENPQIDNIGSLELGVGENQIMEFVDANTNGLFDDGDCFKMNLTRPEEDSVVLTYLLQINDVHTGGYGVLGGLSYIAMMNKGVFWLFGDDTENPYIPSGSLMLNSETEIDGNISAEIVVSRMRGPEVRLEQVELELDGKGTRERWYDLSPGVIYAGDRCSVKLIDADHDEVLSVGDYFLLSGLSNWTNYRLDIGLTGGYYIMFSWTTGIGVSTGFLPVVEWNEPLALDPPVNRSFKLQIGRMYGVPGVLFRDEKTWMVIDGSMNGQSFLSHAKLTENFSYSSPSLDIIFEDSDGNGYVNSGDFFLCNATIPADFELVLGYVNTRGIGHPQHSLISWPVAWQTS